MRQRNDLDMDAVEAAPGHPSRNLLKTVWQRKSLVIVAALGGLLAGFAFYSQRTPVYQTTAQILVVKKRSDPLPVVNDPRLSFYEDYLSTHMVLIRSPLIVEKAVEKRGLGSLRSYVGRGDPSGEIMASLSATRDKDTSGNGSTNIINLSFRAPASDDCETVLNAVLVSYQEFLDATYVKVSDQMVDLIEKASKTLKEDLKEAEKNYQDFRKRSPLLFKGKDGTNLYQERIASIENKRSALQIRKTELEERLKAIDKANQENHGRAAVLALLAANQADNKTIPGQQSLDDKLLPLLLQEQQLLDRFGPDYSEVVSVRNRIALIRNLAGPKSAPGDKAADEVAADPVARFMEGLREELREADMVWKSLGEQLVELRKEAQGMSTYEVEEEHLRGDIVRIQQLHEDTVKRLAEINLVRDAGGFDARTIARPGPGFKVAPNLLQFLFGGLTLGILAGVGLAYLVELTDKGFRTPEEIRRRLGLPVIGNIPLLAPDEEASAKVAAGQPMLEPLFCSYYRPKSVDAEAYRAVRTALYFSTQGEGHKLIQVTSPDMGDGKSTLIGNLAICIAQSGKKTLIIDADLRRPRLHKMLQVPASTGLASVLAGETPLAEATQETVIPNLSVLPCGRLPSNPAELLTSPHFKELLDAARAQYDFVLVDTPPLLAVTDPCVVAPRVDGVILAIRLSKRSGPQAERARDILATLGVKVIGVVVNGVNKQARSGRFTSGSYEYAYGATDYAYNAEQGDESYYEDDDSSGSPSAKPPAGQNEELLPSPRPASPGKLARGRPSGKSPAGILARFLALWV
jgi:capsular exopolysaccharide synthesis family protein